MCLLDSIYFHLLGKITHILATRKQRVLKVVMLPDGNDSCNFQNSTFKNSVQFDQNFNILEFLFLTHDLHYL